MRVRPRAKKGLTAVLDVLDVWDVLDVLEVLDAVLRANLIAACDIVQEVTWVKEKMHDKCRLFMAEVTRLNSKAKAILGVEVRGLSPDIQGAFEMKRSFILERVDRETGRAAGSASARRGVIGPLKPCRGRSGCRRRAR